MAELPPVGELGFVNHLPTLLRNSRTLKSAGTIPCGDDFFVDSRHQTIDVSTELQTVLDVLFGTDPERCYFNLRMFMILQALHATEFITVVLDEFPRITYDLETSLFFDAEFGSSEVIIQPDPGEGLVDVTVIGDLEPDHGAGRLQQNWIIQVEGAVVNNLWGGFYAESWGGVIGLSITNTLDASTVNHDATDRVFPLHSTSVRDDLLSVQFSTAEAEIPNGTYTVSVLARPREDLADIERRIRDLGLSVLDKVFADGDKVKLGKRLFNQHEQLLYRLAGLLISLLFNMEDLRQKEQFVKS